MYISRIVRLVRLVFFSSKGSENQGTAVLSSFLIAVVLWVLVTLSQEYTTRLRFPLHISEIPEDIQITQNTDLEVFADVVGFGNELLIQYWFTKRDTVNFPFRRIEANQGLDLEQYKSEFEKYLPVTLEVQNVEPDFLAVSYEQKVTKRVPLVSKVRVKTKPEYQLLAEPRLEPDSVNVSGPETVLDTLQFWRTYSMISAPFFRKSESMRVPVYDSVEGLRAFPAVVTLHANPERFTQIHLKIPIVVHGTPERATVLLKEKVLEVACLVPMTHYEEMLNSQYEINIHYQEIDTDLPYILPNLDSLPAILRPIYWTPSELSYVIETK